MPLLSFMISTLLAAIAGMFLRLLGASFLEVVMVYIAILAGGTLLLCSTGPSRAQQGSHAEH